MAELIPCRSCKGQDGTILINVWDQGPNQRGIEIRHESRDDNWIDLTRTNKAGVVGWTYARDVAQRFAAEWHAEMLPLPYVDDGRDSACACAGEGGFFVVDDGLTLVNWHLGPGQRRADRLVIRRSDRFTSREIAIEANEWLGNVHRRIKVDMDKERGRAIAPVIGIVFNNDLRGKAICVTGKIGTMTREQVDREIQQYGGCPQQKVDRDTYYLVVGDRPGASKRTAASAFGTTIKPGSWLLDTFDKCRAETQRLRRENEAQKRAEDERVRRAELARSARMKREEEAARKKAAADIAPERDTNQPTLREYTDYLKRANARFVTWTGDILKPPSGATIDPITRNVTGNGKHIGYIPAIWTKRPLAMMAPAACSPNEFKNRVGLEKARCAWAATVQMRAYAARVGDYLTTGGLRRKLQPGYRWDCFTSVVTNQTGVRIGSLPLGMIDYEADSTIDWSDVTGKQTVEIFPTTEEGRADEWQDIRTDNAFDPIVRVRTGKGQTVAELIGEMATENTEGITARMESRFDFADPNPAMIADEDEDADAIDWPQNPPPARPERERRQKRDGRGDW